jgi:hypothetical protein
MELSKEALDLIEKGFELQIGKHYEGLAGYHASFVPRKASERKECGCRKEEAWDKTAHAMVPSVAIKIAVSLANGEKVDIPDTNIFELAPI